MIYSKIVTCAICGSPLSKLGLGSHVNIKHGIDAESYKKKYVYTYRSCRECGKPTLKSFCGQHCVNVYRSKLSISKSKSKKVFPDSFIKEVVEFYKRGPVTLEAVGERFNVSRDVVMDILKSENINRYGAVILRDIRSKDKFDTFLESDTVKRLLEDYKANGGCIRGISKKYLIARRTLRKILDTCGIIIKDGVSAKREVTSVKLSKGIRGDRYGKTPPVGAGKCRWYSYNGVKYQGSWEFLTGLWLKESGKRFLCHTDVKRFEYVKDGVNRTYCPDFYLPDEDRYLEVKGYFTEADKEKIRQVIATHGIDVEVVDKGKMASLGIFGVDKRVGVDIDKYELDYKTGKSYSDQFLSKVSKDTLLDDYLVKGISQYAIADKYGIPRRIIWHAFRAWEVPRRWSNKRTVGIA